jgi:hypothetical protein
MENEKKPGQNPNEKSYGEDQQQKDDQQRRQPGNEQGQEKRAPGQTEGDRDQERKRA